MKHGKQAPLSTLNIEGFWDFYQVKPKHKNATGGIIHPGLKLVQNSEGFLWIRQEKSFFNIEVDIFLCGAYIPPKSTTQIYYLKRTTLAL